MPKKNYELKNTRRRKWPKEELPADVEEEIVWSQQQGICRSLTKQQPYGGPAPMIIRTQFIYLACPRLT